MALKISMQPRTIVISGPSGSGKSTLVTALIKEYPTVFALTTSYTTREPRFGEQNGREYHFIKRTEMETMISNEEMFEWSEFSSNLYGTSKKTVEEVAKSGRLWLRILDKGGVINTRESNHNALFIFINTPNCEVLEQRLRDRKSDTENVIKNRLLEAKQSIEFSQQHGIYDHIIINDQFDVALNELKQFLQKEITSVLQQTKTMDIKT